MPANTSGAPTGAPRIFTPEASAAILSQEPHVGTGVIVPIRGFDVDLCPFTTEEGLLFLALVERTSEFQTIIGNGDDGVKNLMKMVADEGPVILELMRTLLHRSLQVTADSEDAFALWFATVPMVPTLQALVPALIKANGFGQMMNPPAAAAAQATPIASRRRQRTQSSTS